MHQVRASLASCCTYFALYCAACWRALVAAGQVFDRGLISGSRVSPLKDWGLSVGVFWSEVWRSCYARAVFFCIWPAHVRICNMRRVAHWRLFFRCRGSSLSFRGCVLAILLVDQSARRYCVVKPIAGPSGGGAWLRIWLSPCGLLYATLLGLVSVGVHSRHQLRAAQQAFVHFILPAAPHVRLSTVPPLAFSQMTLQFAGLTVVLHSRAAQQASLHLILPAAPFVRLSTVPPLVFPQVTFSLVRLAVMQHSHHQLRAAQRAFVHLTLPAAPHARLSTVPTLAFPQTAFQAVRLTVVLHFSAA